MVNLLYLAVPVTAILVAAILLSLRDHRPRSIEAGVEEFSRSLQALAPEPGLIAGSRSGRRSVGPRGGTRPG